MGFYYRDTRYLDTWELTINGYAATPLLSEPRTNSRSVIFVMTNKDLPSLDYGHTIPRDRLRIMRLVTLENDQVYEQVEITNYDSVPHTLEVERRAGSRFNDIFEVRGMRREASGELHAPRLTDDRRTLVLSYTGLDRRSYSTHLWSPDPVTNLTQDGNTTVISHRCQMPPRSKTTLKYVISFDREPLQELFGAASITDLSTDMQLERIAAAASKQRLPLPQIITDNERLNRGLEIAGADIASLMTKRQDSYYPDAGIPWFCAPFGRDGIITAYQLLPWCPSVAEGVLEVAFSTLGQKFDSYTDEEPGKVFHEHRFGEMARMKEIPFIPYYGAVDGTPLSLILLGEYIEWTGNLAFANRWWEQATQALSWVLTRLQSGRGFLTYQAGSPRGLRNQGWKDSYDAVMHADGTLAEPPIALCEVQGYAYRALRSMTRLAEQLGRTNHAAAWLRAADELRTRFAKHFWDEGTGSVYLALDGGGRPCQVLSSNMGQCLWSGILDQAQAERVTGHLIGPNMFSGYGVRTLSSAEAAYNPLSYHNGSIWPHDNAIIAEGLRLYHQSDALCRLAGGLADVVEGATDSRLPELYCGFEKYGNGSPVPYDVACKPQAWAAGTMFLVLKALLGMRYQDHALVFHAPLLPPQIASMEIKGLRLRDFELDLHVRQGRLTSTIEVLSTTGGASRVMVVN